jgi:DNA-directed RNA polymerase subunit RPC12/RpoP
MSDTYDLIIHLKKKIKVDKIIQFFLDRKFRYLEELGFFNHKLETYVKIPLNEAINEMNKNGGGLSIRNKIEMGISYTRKHNLFTVYIWPLQLEKPGTKEIVKEFIKFMEDNYPIKEIKEMMGKDEEYPFAYPKKETKAPNHNYQTCPECSRVIFRIAKNKEISCAACGYYLGDSSGQNKDFIKCSNCKNKVFYLGKILSREIICAKCNKKFKIDEFKGD